MSFRIANPFWRWVILSLTVLLFLVVAYADSKSAYADQMESSPRPEDWLRAAQIEPDNGAYWYKLGLYREWDIDNGDLNKAIELLSRAAALDPRSAGYAMSLAGAYETAGQIQKARESYLAALEDYPLSPETHWRYGSFLLRQGDAKQAFAEINRAVHGDRALIPLAVSRVWLETRDVQPLLTTVLPSDVESHQSALEWFCAAKEPEAALAVWKRMIGLHQTIPIKNSFPLEEILLSANRGDEARQVWKEALAASGNRNETGPNGSLVFNGGFESDPANGGLDWHVIPMPGVTIDSDSSAPHSGGRALRLKFDGTQNVALQAVWQVVPVEPLHRYRFEGYMRTSGITTDSGVRLAIWFMGSKQEPIILDNNTGDHPWVAQTAEFFTFPDVHEIKIMVFRPTSQKFDNKLGGTAWVDDVSLIDVTAISSRTAGHP
jgi:tetratricopeptide (TPR) repeat protein